MRDDQHRPATCALASGSARSRRAAMPISCCSTTCPRFRSGMSMPTASWCRSESPIQGRKCRSTGQTGRRKTMNVGRKLTAEDFAIAAEPGRNAMKAAILRPFHWDEDYLVEELPVAGWRSTARRRAHDHQMGDRRPLHRQGRRSQRCSGPAQVRAIPTRRSPARSPMTTTISGASARQTKRWPRRSIRVQEIDGGWVLVHRGRSRRRGPARSRRPDDGTARRKLRQ